jgi:hypothetical protein
MTGTPLVEVSTTGQVFAAKVVHYAEEAGAAAIAERVASPVCGLCLT